MASLISLPIQNKTDAQGFYTARDAARIARVPRSRLDAWRRDKIITPTLQIRDPDGDEDGYTFEALVYLRLLRMLRGTNIPLSKAVEALKSLRERAGPPRKEWAEIRLFRRGSLIFVKRADEWETTTATGHETVLRHQKEMPLFNDEFALMRERVDALLVPPKFQHFVEIDPAARSGLPILRGTTITTSLIHRLRQLGETPNDIKESYPVLTLAQIRAADKYESLLDVEALAA